MNKKVNYTELFPRPAQEDINSGLSALPTAELIKIFGQPGKKATENCSPITNPILKKFMITMNLGKFRVTGMNWVIGHLMNVFAEIKQVEPELYEIIGTAGMLCYRLVRGSTTALSNHSLGCPIDLTIDGKLDTRGDNKVQLGLLRAYPIFHKHGFYWGAEYKTEDAMHFEPSYELFLEHKKEILRGINE